MAKICSKGWGSNCCPIRCRGPLRRMADTPSLLAPYPAGTHTSAAMCMRSTHRRSPILPTRAKWWRNSDKCWWEQPHPQLHLENIFPGTDVVLTAVDDSAAGIHDLDRMITSLRTSGSDVSIDNRRIVPRRGVERGRMYLRSRVHTCTLCVTGCGITVVRKQGRFNTVGLEVLGASHLVGPA